MRKKFAGYHLFFFHSKLQKTHEPSNFSIKLRIQGEKLFEETKYRLLLVREHLTYGLPENKFIDVSEYIQNNTRDIFVLGGESVKGVKKQI
jgi:hypothetical protein